VHLAPQPDLRHLPPQRRTACWHCYHVLQTLSVYPIDVTWSRDSEHPSHLSALKGNHLTGFMCGHGPTHSDYWV